MQENPAHSVIMKTVGEIRTAEDQYDKKISEAKEKSDSVLRKAREEIAAENAKMKEEITKFKNEKLKSGKSSIEKDVNKTIEEAKDDAEAIRGKKANKAKLVAIGKSFISEL